jgi:PAS fold
MDHGQTDRAVSGDVVVMAGAVPEIAPKGPSMPGFIDLYRATDLMQEAALVLTRGVTETDSAIADFRTRHINDSARRALRAAGPDLIGRGLPDIVPTDTAVALHRLCAEAVRTGRTIERFAVAPDPITDLSGTSSIAVRVTDVEDAVLCTWVPGWHVVGEEEDRRLATTTGIPIADRLELAAALDALGDAGVFSFNLMTGRLIWSAGLYKLFGRKYGDGPMDVTEWRSLTEPEPVFSSAWHALIRDGVPVDVEVKLVPSLGGHRLRVAAFAVPGPDRHPTAIRGRCCVIGP